MRTEDPFFDARQKMVESQIIRRGIKDKRVLNALRNIPRHRFTPSHLWEDAYDDCPLPIGSDQTISQPYIVALMTSQLELAGNEKVLEIGTGSGYQAAILSSLAAEVYTIERIEELAEKAEALFKELGIKNIHVIVGDGTLGWKENAPYDRIITTAAAPYVPEALKDQLGIGGKLVIPVGSRWRQMLEKWSKSAEGLEREEVLPVVFVPLLGEEGWQDSEL